jgi:hypothetical protein
MYGIQQPAAYSNEGLDAFRVEPENAFGIHQAAFEEDHEKQAPSGTALPQMSVQRH